MIINYNVLILSDNDFETRIKNKQEYQDRLMDYIDKRTKGKNLTIKSVSGKYSFVSDKISSPVINIEDKNKTAFVNSIMDSIDKIDEIIIITNFPNEPFLSALQNKIGELKKSLTLYTYEERINEQAVVN